MVFIAVPGITNSYAHKGVLYLVQNDLGPMPFTAYDVPYPDQFMRELNRTITTTNVDSIIGHYWIIGDDDSWNLTEAPDLYTSPRCEHSPFL
jgi:hypothetical protein